MGEQFDSSRPIYAQLVERLKAKILAGTYPPGSHLDSVRDLAAAAGVSVAVKVLRHGNELEFYLYVPLPFFYRRWGTQRSGALDWLEQGVKNGAGELVVNSIDTDGVKNGFDLELLDAVAQRCAVPIIASGGAGKMEDFKELFLNHPRVDAGLAASIFHTKQVDIRDLKLYLRENGVEMRV